MLRLKGLLCRRLIDLSGCFLACRVAPTFRWALARIHSVGLKADATTPCNRARKVRLSSRRQIGVETEAQPRGEFLASAPQAGLQRVARNAQCLRRFLGGKSFNFAQPECGTQKRRNFRELFAHSFTEFRSGVNLLGIRAFIGKAFG